MVSLRKFEWVLFVLVFGGALFLLRPEGNKLHVFQGDDLRYMSYAVSMHEHGVFGLSHRDITQKPTPGNANAPLYPAMIAGVMALDDDFAQNVICAYETGGAASCNQNFNSFFLFQKALALLCLALTYMITVRFSGKRLMGWMAAGLILVSGVLQEFSNIFMTEILILPGFAALILVGFNLDKKITLRRVIVFALILAFLTLVRPSYLYLFYGAVLLFGGLVVIKRTKVDCLRLGILIFGFVTAVFPWAARNYMVFGDASLTSGGYGEAILVQRVNYNQMSWPEVGVAMIYWLPDFGDSLAKDLFSQQWYEKLGWGAGTYYDQGYQKQIAAFEDDLGGREKILGHLIKYEMLTLKHIAVSVPLALRGALPAKYWGLIGFVAFLFLLVKMVRCRDYGLVVMALPVFFMVAFHAGLSVSIPRYNLPLIYLYALSMAFYLHSYGYKIFEKTTNRS